MQEASLGALEAVLVQEQEFLLKLVLEVEALALSESNTVRARGLC